MILPQEFIICFNTTLSKIEKTNVVILFNQFRTVRQNNVCTRAEFYPANGCYKKVCLLAELSLLGNPYFLFKLSIVRMIAMFYTICSIFDLSSELSILWVSSVWLLVFSIAIVDVPPWPASPMWLMFVLSLWLESPPLLALGSLKL